MQVKEEAFSTYRSLNNWQNFRIKLFAEGILVGIFSGLVISFFRFILHFVEINRIHIYNYLISQSFMLIVFVFITLTLVAALLIFLTKSEPLAAAIGIA